MNDAVGTDYFRAFIACNGKLPDYIRVGSRAAVSELGQRIIAAAVDLGIEVILEGTIPN